MKRGALFLLTLLAGGAHAQNHGIAGIWQAEGSNRLLTPQGQLPPLKPAALAAYNANQAAAAKGDLSWDPVAKCKPPGEPRTLMQDNMPFEIAVSPARVDFLFQWNRLDRIIGIKGTEPDNEGPYYFGVTTASWEGATLVTQVTNIKENTFLDATGLPHTDDAVLTERFHTTADGNTLIADIHVKDPEYYSAEWNTQIRFKRLPANTRIPEDVCMDRKKLNDYATIYNAVQDK